MADTYIDFRIVKERISIQRVLDHYGVRLRRINQHALRGKCPLPTHSSENSKESFCVDDGKNIWSCASASCAAARQGKKGGNILDLTAIMERCSIRDAALKLHTWFLSSAPTAATEPAGKTESPATQLVAKRKEDESRDVNKPLSFTLKDIDCTHPYVRQRGIEDETAEHFGVGFFPGKGSMSGRMVIPIHNENGELMAYAGRSIDGAEPKYKLPSGFQKSAVLYNLHRAIAVGERGLIIVEGFFDCMKVSQAGYPFVVALMGSTLSEEQERLLIAHTDMVIILLDGDAAGRTGAQSIAARLMYRTFVKVINLPDGKEPDELSSEELKRILSSH